MTCWRRAIRRSRAVAYVLRRSMVRRRGHGGGAGPHEGSVVTRTSTSSAWTIPANASLATAASDRPRCGSAQPGLGPHPAGTGSGPPDLDLLRPHRSCVDRTNGRPCPAVAASRSRVSEFVLSRVAIGQLRELARFARARMPDGESPGRSARGGGVGGAHAGRAVPAAALPLCRIRSPSRYRPVRTCPMRGRQSATTRVWQRWPARRGAHTHWHRSAPAARGFQRSDLRGIVVACRRACFAFGARGHACAPTLRWEHTEGLPQRAGRVGFAFARLAAGGAGRACRGGLRGRGQGACGAAGECRGLAAGAAGWLRVCPAAPGGRRRGVQADCRVRGQVWLPSGGAGACWRRRAGAGVAAAVRPVVAGFGSRDPIRASGRPDRGPPRQPESAAAA